MTLCIIYACINACTGISYIQYMKQDLVFNYNHESLVFSLLVVAEESIELLSVPGDMAWFTITARFKVPGIVLLTIILVNLSHQLEQPMHVSNQNHHGSCASIGYSAKCCPPGESCEASDGNCKCSTRCHNKLLNNCCKDVFCHPSNNYNVYHIIIIIMINN